MHPHDRCSPIADVRRDALTLSRHSRQSTYVLAMAMHIETPRFLLRDFFEADRQSFIDYQMDPRYQGLYDWVDADAGRASTLFDRFSVWRQQNPRQNFQVGIFERTSSRLCGCAGLRQAGKSVGTAVFGLELTPNDWGRMGWRSKWRALS